MDELIEFLLTLADDAHKAHLATRSYAEHMALGDFYEGIREDADALFEALIAMGKVPGGQQENPAEFLKEQYRQFQEMRDICDDDPSVQNLFDTVGGHFMSAIYKLSRLDGK